MASPSAADVRWTTLLNALARPTCAGGTAAMPPVMIGIMPRPMPNARRQSSPTRCSWVVSRVSTCISYVPQALTDSPTTAGQRGPKRS